MNRQLVLSVDSFDQVNTVYVNVGRGRHSTARLMRDYEVRGDGIYWLLSIGATLKSEYTEADRAEIIRLSKEPVIQNDDIVEIEGELYKVKVLGAYSNCAVLSKV